LVWRFIKKLTSELPYDSATPLLGIYLKECKSGYGTDTCTLFLTALLFTIAKLWNQPRYLTTDERIEKMWYIYTMGIIQL
jgi:hypothetical protein